MRLKLANVNKSAKKVLEQLTEGLVKIEDHRKVSTSEAFMPVCVELIGFLYENPVFSVAHYFEQNGDLMADPEMTFGRSKGGEFAPFSFKQDSLGIFKESVIHSPTEGDPDRFLIDPVMQRDQATFANVWMRNIKEQQFL